MPPFLASLFSAGASTLVDSIGEALDKIFTSDEQRIKVTGQVKKIVFAHKERQMEALAAYEKEVTARHATDMKSDSWLSKNVRPCVLVFLVVATVLLAYLTIFFLPPDKAELVEPWLDLLKVLDVTVISFYFGSRGFEKVQHAKRG